MQFKFSWGKKTLSNGQLVEWLKDKMMKYCFLIDRRGRKVKSQVKFPDISLCFQIKRGVNLVQLRDSDMSWYQL